MKMISFMSYWFLYIPVYIVVIIRSSCANPMDLSNSTVLNPILSDLNNANSSSSSSRPRYELRMWERTIPFHSKKTNSSQTVKARRPYIFDTVKTWFYNGTEYKKPGWIALDC